MIGFGSDNTNVMVGSHSGLSTLLKPESPYLVANGCFAHLFQLVNKHSCEQYMSIIEYDKLLKKLYKFFSKSCKTSLDLQKWFAIKNLKYHKLLNIFDIRWLSKCE